MPKGTVKFFDNSKGYGFIADDAGGKDAFVHISAVEAAGMTTLDKEQRLSYDLENDQRGKSSAVNLQAAWYRSGSERRAPSRRPSLQLEIGRLSWRMHIGSDASARRSQMPELPAAR